MYIKFKFVTLCWSFLFYFHLAPPHIFFWGLHMHVCLWQLFILIMQLVLNLVKIRKVDVKRWFQFTTKDNDVFKFGKFGLRCKITIIIVFGCCILNMFHERYAHELCEVENGSNPMICKVTFIFSCFDLQCFSCFLMKFWMVLFCF